MARDLSLKVTLQALDKATGPLRAMARSSAGLGQALKDTRSQLKGLQNQQRDLGSFKALKAASQSTAQQLQANREQLRGLSQQLAATDNPSKALTASFKRAAREGANLKAQHAAQQRELQGLRSQLQRAGINTQRLGTHERELRQRINQTNASLAQQEARLKRVGQQQRRLIALKAEYESSQRLAGGMAASGAGALATGSGMLYTGARMLAPGLEFDASMSKVQALTRLDKTNTELAALRQQALDLGATTQFTGSQAADGQGYLAMAGFAPNAIRAAMPGMLSLAKAGDSELAETADIASNILTGFNLQAGQMGRVGDVLVATFTRSNTNLQMLGDTMKYVAPVAAGVGQDIETVAAMAGKLGDAGIQGSMGGTALRAIISRLAKPPKMAADALKALNIQTQDANGNLRDLPGLLGELHEKTKALGSAERAGFFKSIAGEEAFSGLQVLVQQAGNGGLQTLIKDLRAANGEAETTARVMGDNLKGDLSALGSAWEDLGIQLQDQQNGPLRELTQSITSVIGSVKAWVSENPELASQLVKTAAGFAVLVAAGGALSLALASVLGPFAVLRYGMGLFGLKSLSLGSTLLSLGRTALPLVGKGILLIGRALMLNPIGLAITAIAGGAYLIYKHWEPIKGFFLGLWGEIKQGFSGGLLGIAETLTNFSPVGLFYRAFAGVLSYLGVDLPSKFTDFGGMLMQGLVNGIKSAIGSVKDTITGLSDSTIGWFKEKLGIHSPSRVFASLGGYTMQGLAQGLEQNQRAPLAAVSNVGKALVAAGAITLSNPAMAIDTRPPLGTHSAKPAAASSAPINITINAAPGMNEQTLAQLVAREVARITHGQSVRARAALHDTE